jgi:hypothetical protein
MGVSEVCSPKTVRQVDPSNWKTFCRAVTGSITLASLVLAPSAYAQFVLTPVPGLPGASAGSAAWGDYDGDGRLDFLLSGSLASSLWRNTGNGFSNVTSAMIPGLPGLSDSAVAWGDFDNDGRLDLLVTGLTNLSGGAVSQLWRNTGSGFTNVPIPGVPGVAESSVAWIDFDGDGRLDFFIAGSSNGVSSGAVSQLWRNTGNGFTNVPIPGLPGTFFGSVAWADFDNDGRPDFLITGISNSTNSDLISQLWRNTGNGFTNTPIPGLRGIYASSVAWADFDNDGLLDFLLEGLAGNTFISELWRNTGNGFSKILVPGLPGIADGSLAWGDFDNDGRPDFLITGLTNGTDEVSQIWLNTGSGLTNLPVPGLLGNFDNWVACGDLDNDSRLDFLIAGSVQGTFSSQLWQNTMPSSNSPPAAPGGLASIVSGDSVTLLWNAPFDDHTPSSGLSYNLRVGTAPGGSDVARAPALPTGKLLIPQMGSVRNGSAVLHHLKQNRTYYWSVQAIDSAFAGSRFAMEQQFSTGPVLNPVRRTNGVFEINFTSVPGARFSVLAATNLSLTTSNWTVVGTATEASAGQFRFTDIQATNTPRRFYRVRLL